MDTVKFEKNFCNAPALFVSGSLAVSIAAAIIIISIIIIICVIIITFPGTA